MVELGEADLSPKLTFNRPPPYPPAAYQQWQQGRVLLEAKISAQGTVESLRILESSGVASLDEAALVAVRSWQFEPARRGSTAISSLVEVPVRFSLRGR